jgi:hypothetical protein
MVNEAGLRDALLSLTEDAKTHYIMLSSILAEVEALRETVRSLDPTFADVMEQKRIESVERNAALVRTVVDGYDQILRRLNAGEVC